MIQTFRMSYFLTFSHRATFFFGRISVSKDARIKNIMQKIFFCVLGTISIATKRSGIQFLATVFFSSIHLLNCNPDTWTLHSARDIFCYSLTRPKEECSIKTHATASFVAMLDDTSWRWWWWWWRLRTRHTSCPTVIDDDDDDDHRKGFEKNCC